MAGRHTGQKVESIGVSWRRVVTQKIGCKMKEREWGPQLPSFHQGWLGVFIHQGQVVGDNVHYTEGERKWGKRVKES